MTILKAIAWISCIGTVLCVGWVAWVAWYLGDETDEE